MKSQGLTLDEAYVDIGISERWLDICWTIQSENIGWSPIVSLPLQKINGAQHKTIYKKKVRLGKFSKFENDTKSGERTKHVLDNTVSFS